MTVQLQCEYGEYCAEDMYDSCREDATFELVAGNPSFLVKRACDRHFAEQIGYIITGDIQQAPNEQWRKIVID